jgi:hypothetical protein
LAAALLIEKGLDLIGELFLVNGHQFDLLV